MRRFRPQGLPQGVPRGRYDGRWRPRPRPLLPQRQRCLAGQAPPSRPPSRRAIPRSARLRLSRRVRAVHPAPRACWSWAAGALASGGAPHERPRRPVASAGGHPRRCGPPGPGRRVTRLSAARDASPGARGGLIIPPAGAPPRARPAAPPPAPDGASPPPNLAHVLLKRRGFADNAPWRSGAVPFNRGCVAAARHTNAASFGIESEAWRLEARSASRSSRRT
jgi:hypothetical protein